MFIGIYMSIGLIYMFAEITINKESAEAVKDEDDPLALGFAVIIYLLGWPGIIFLSILKYFARRMH